MQKLYWLLLIIIILPRVGASQHPRATLAECAQVIVGDSVILYYDQSYVLTPPACAVVQRHARLDSAGNFRGPVRDYRTADQALLVEARFAHNVLAGPVTLYHPNGQVAAQGQFDAGQRAGDWYYWYASGQPRQVVRFPTDRQMRILAYWDETGRQLATQGTGTWVGEDERGNRYGGPIRFGLPDGRWEAYRADTRALCATEIYENGRFRRGRLAARPAPGATSTYRSPLLMPHGAEFFDRVSLLELGLPCADRQQQQLFQLIARSLQLPAVKGGVAHYGNIIAQRLIRYGEEHWYEVLPEKVTVRCSLNAQGQFDGFSSAAPSFQAVIKQLVTMIGAWTPARYRGQPVPGYLDVTLDKTTREVRVRPAARLPADVVSTAAPVTNP